MHDGHGETDHLAAGDDLLGESIDVAHEAAEVTFALRGGCRIRRGFGGAAGGAAQGDAEGERHAPQGRAS